MSTYAERQAYRDAHPGVIVDATSAYDPSTGQQTNPFSGGGGGGGGGNPGSIDVTNNTSASAILQAARIADSQLRAAQAATASANAQDFAQRVSEFNQNHALALQNFGLTQQAQQFDQALRAAGLTGMYNGQQTQQAQQQQFSQGVTAAGLTGMYNGQQTQQAQQQAFTEALQAGQTSGIYNGQPTEAARQFNTNTGVDLTKLGASLSGPADYFKFNNAMNGGKNILQSLTGNQARPAFSAPQAGAIQPLTLSSIMDRLGIQSGASGGSTGGGQQISASNQTAIPGGSGAQPQSGQSAMGLTLPNGMGSIPLPHQINPSVWDSWGPTGQAFIKSAAASAGYDPTEFEKQINATRPGTGTYGAQSQGASSGPGGGGVSAY